MENEFEHTEKIKTLSTTVWGNKLSGPQIKTWLENFNGDEEKLYALFLLSRMMYFTSFNIRNLLKALYRDLYRYPIIERVRKANGNTLDEAIIESGFNDHLNKTLFLGIGQASESGEFLTYYFRQENKLSKKRFATIQEIVETDSSGKPKLKSAYATIRHFVFIDDVCGSGSQATNNESGMRNLVIHLRMIDPTFQISYYMLFAKNSGIDNVKNAEVFPKTNPRVYPYIPLYNDVRAVVELDETYKCFGDESRYFEKSDSDKKKIETMARTYGEPMAKVIGLKNGFSDTTNPTIDEYSRDNALGFGDCQLLLSMEHNTPDNTLPIIWFDEDENMWKPILKRYNKIY